MSASSYNNESIRAIKGADRIRNRPEVMLGTRGIDGAKHTVIEIVGNATDEKLSGYGDKLIIKLYEDGSISVRDYGRGIPLGWNEAEQNWNYFLIFEELYAGGKYDDNQELLKKINAENAWDKFNINDYPYLITIGLNGLGAAATQCSSAYFEVISYRDGKASRMHYTKGVHDMTELEITNTEEPNGTFIHWKPDDEVFDSTNITAKWLSKLCKSLSYVAEFNVTFIDKDKANIYEAKTLLEAMQEVVGSDCVEAHNFTHSTDAKGDICICDADIVLGKGGRGFEYFHNRVELKGGAHANAINNALYDFFDMISREQGIKIREGDYAGMFSVILSTLSNKMSLRGQTKDSLDDSFVANCLYSVLINTLKTEYAKGTSWLIDIVDDVIVNAQNRIAVAEMSKNLKEIEKATKKVKASDKFVTCLSYEQGKAEETDYFIVEGDSAGGTVKVARNAMYQCYQAIRGKSLNVYKATIQQLIDNREIKDMIAALGCGIDLGIEGYESFDINKLKVGRIYFLSDADIDGKHIRMLLFLIFYKLFPELLYQGKVYILETPLYIINCVDNTVVYCMDEEDLKAKRKELGGMIRSIDRFKGLGEVDPDVLWETTLNPETRVARQLKIERNDMALCDALEVLFGKSTERRKRAILGSMIEDYDGKIDEMQSLSEFIESLNLDDSLEVEEVLVG